MDAHSARTNALTRVACLALLCFMPIDLAAAGAGAAADSATKQSRDDAWWTGPLLAPSASTLPRGHFLIEPYVFNSIVYAREDADGGETPVPREHVSGTLTYVLYGLTDRLTVGAIPRFGINHVIDGESSGGAGVSDLELQAQYRLALFHEGRRLPTISLAIGESLPTGKFDQLGDRRSDALGSGAYTTTLSVYSQYFFWMPTGRILRTRLNVSYSTSNAVAVRDASVYGTPTEFRGRAHPGDSVVVDSAWETASHGDGSPPSTSCTSGTRTHRCAVANSRRARGRAGCSPWLRPSNTTGTAGWG